eukprot:symbB.v1.2.007761.t1/scaffold480.1/size253386/23
MADWEVLWNQVVALALNLQIWFVRQVLRRPSPPFDVKVKLENGNSGSTCAKIVGPGGVDQVQAFNDSWAVCGYNLMKEFGSQQLASPPSPLRPDLVVVRNKAFSINYADICIRWGLYESALRYVGWPIIPGFDIAGEVEMAGAESGFSVGDRVFGCSFFGAYASRVVVPSWQVMKMPDDMAFESAAALPTVVLTALHAVNLARAPELLGRGRDALVHSAAGGVGDMLCQLLRIYGLRVVGVVGSQSKVSSCKADVVIDKSSEDWVKAAHHHAPEGYRAVFDANGVATLKASYNLLARNGRLVVYGFHSNLPKCDGGLGALSPLNWLRMALDLARTPHFDPMFLTLDSKAVLGFNLSFFSDEIETGEKYLSQLKTWVDGGKIQVPPVRTFPFSQLRDAHNALTSGQSVGKMVERLYGLSNPQGNHGEDVKELYYYLDATPTHSYMKMMYKYPQAEFPYDELRRVNFERKKDPLLLEYELLDTGIFDDNRYFDVEIEYAQAEPDDTLVQITAHNRGKDEADLCILPQAWFRNTWSWNHSKRPSMTYVADERRIEIVHEKLGTYNLYVEENTEVIFCENDTHDAHAVEGALSPYKESEPTMHIEVKCGDFRSLEPAAWHDIHSRFGTHLGPKPGAQETGKDQGFRYHLSGRSTGCFKDGFHDYVIRGDKAAVSSAGTKAGFLTRHKVAGGSHVSVRLRLAKATKSFEKSAFADFGQLIQHRREDADRFYMFLQDDIHSEERRMIHRQARLRLW